MSDAPIGVLAQVLAAMPAALAFVAPDGSRADENERMGVLPAAVRKQAIDGAGGARTDGVGFLELLDEQGRIWRFDYTTGERAGDVIVIGTDVSDAAAWEGATREALIALADEAMYLAKRSGGGVVLPAAVARLQRA